MLEPAAGGIHAAVKAQVEPGASVAVLGAGTMGLCSLAALRAVTPAGTVIATAKHPHQRDLATELGADVVVDPHEVRPRCAAVLRLSDAGRLPLRRFGHQPSTRWAVRHRWPTPSPSPAPRGRVVLLGMPEVSRTDLTGLWHRETELVGAYTYGTETLPDGTTATSFALAFDLVESANLETLVSARYPLHRYREAIAHAAEAGPRGAVKVVFEQDS